MTSFQILAAFGLCGFQPPEPTDPVWCAFVQRMGRSAVSGDEPSEILLRWLWFSAGWSDQAGPSINPSGTVYMP